VNWTTWAAVLSADGSSSELYSVNFAVFTEEFLTQSFGWSALLWQGWAVTNFTVNAEVPTRYLIQVNGSREFFLDGELYLGNYYSYPQGWTAVSLAPGPHVLAVKLESSVRMYGFTANVSVVATVQPAKSAALALLPAPPLLPDLVEGELASVLAALPVLNVGLDTLDEVQVVQVLSNGRVQAASRAGVRIAPGQLTNLAFEITPGGDWIDICVESSQFAYPACLLRGQFPLRQRFLNQSFIFTFEDYDGSVQLASLLLPAEPWSSNATYPVVLATHGAGVDTQSPDWDVWVDALPRLQDAFVLLPSGRRPWGYDWQGPSALSAFAALEYAARELPGLPPSAPVRMDSSRVLFLGHSMGGHGAWLLAAQHADQALAALPAAGFMAVERYVPYELNLYRAHLDPILCGLLEASLAPYNAALHSSNLAGLPLLTRFGQLDDNVPPLHSKRMARIIDEWAAQPDAVQVSAVPGEGHWWPHALDAPEVAVFLGRCLAAPPPPFPSTFTVTSASPATVGPRGSLLILQTLTPARVARMHVQISESNETHRRVWNIRTENLRRFCLTGDPRGPPSDAQLIVDGQTLDEMHYCSSAHYCLEYNRWTVCARDDFGGSRTPRQLGPLGRILERPLIFVYGTAGDPVLSARLQAQALLLANSWFLYGNGNASVLPDAALSSANASQYSLVLLGGPDQNSWTRTLLADSPCPIRVETATSDSDTPALHVGDYRFTGPGIGAAFLLPWGTEQFALLLFGLDDAGQRSAARLFPARDSMPLPEWIVVGPEFSWLGLASLVGAGYWSPFWQIAPQATYVRASVQYAPPVSSQTQVFVLIVVIATGIAIVTVTLAGILLIHKWKRDKDFQEYHPVN
jgi:hypothetical protein